MARLMDATCTHHHTTARCGPHMFHMTCCLPAQWGGPRMLHTLLTRTVGRTSSQLLCTALLPTTLIRALPPMCNAQTQKAPSVYHANKSRTRPSHLLGRPCNEGGAGVCNGLAARRTHLGGTHRHAVHLELPVTLARDGHPACVYVCVRARWGDDWMSMRTSSQQSTMIGVTCTHASAAACIAQTCYHETDSWLLSSLFTLPLSTPQRWRTHNRSP
jgi:hypothetical protein